jgi:hypothetical protein
MGQKKEDKKKPLPPVFTGEAVCITFPDLQLPDKSRHPFRVTTFPHWIHSVYVGDQVYEVLGKDLEIGMAFMIDGHYLQIIDLDKRYLYHGMEIQMPKLGQPCNPRDYPTYKFVRVFDKDNVQRWEVTLISEPKGDTK